MSERLALQDPWQQTVCELHRHSVVTVARTTDAAARRKERRRQWVHAACFAIPTRAAEIRVIDRPSPITATISWIDPTVCRYEEQTWRELSARTDGRCAISGKPITRGDAVYQPVTIAQVPLNAHAMILSSVIVSAGSPHLAE